MSKKIIVLLLLLLIQSAACADNNIESSNQPFKVIDKPAFTCELAGETPELALTYKDGHTLRFDLPVKLLYSGLDEYENACIASGCSIIIYEDILAVFVPASPYCPEQNSVLKISRDAGETWQDMTVPADDWDITASALGFTSQNNVWLLLEGGLGAGHAQLRFYKSGDGGDTWAYEVIGAPVADAPVEDRRLDYINFFSEDEGYLSVGAGFYGAAPMLYKTIGGGESWLECKVKTSIKDDYFTVDDIRYVDDVLVMSGHLVQGGETVILTSEDGLTWIQE